MEISGWEMANNGYIKINVHAVSYNHQFENGNNSGIGVVLRYDNGDIIVMVSGSLPNLTPWANELWAMLIGFRCAYSEKKHRVELETESADAVKEWEDWRWFLDPNHANVIGQLERRTKDKKLKYTVKVIGESQNALARYLAVDGAENRNRMVVFRRPFVRVREIWNLDMGLGLVNGDFDLIEEEDFMQIQQHEINDEVEGVGEWLVQDEVSANAAVAH